MHTVLITDTEDGRGARGRSMQANTDTHKQTFTHTGKEGWGEQERDRMGLMIMLQEGWRPSLPIRLGLMLSLSLLSATEWDPFPQEAPVPGASRQAVLVPTLLWLYGIMIAVYVIYQRYCADRSATLTQHDINNTCYIKM